MSDLHFFPVFLFCLLSSFAREAYGGSGFYEFSYKKTFEYP